VVDFGMCVAREASPRNRECPFYEGRHQFALEKYMGGGFIRGGPEHGVINESSAPC
jgi:hypothetical protein